MTRVKSGPSTRKYHKKIIKMAKGYVGRSKNSYRIAVEKVEKGLQYAFAHRKLKKRSFRSLWIQQINAGCLSENYRYSSTIHNLSKKNILLNRKMLAELASLEPLVFKSVLSVSDINE